MSPVNAKSAKGEGRWAEWHLSKGGKEGVEENKGNKQKNITQRTRRKHLHVWGKTITLWRQEGKFCLGTVVWMGNVPIGSRSLQLVTDTVLGRLWNL